MFIPCQAGTIELSFDDVYAVSVSAHDHVKIFTLAVVSERVRERKNYLLKCHSVADAHKLADVILHALTGTPQGRM